MKTDKDRNLIIWLLIAIAVVSFLAVLNNPAVFNMLGGVYEWIGMQAFGWIATDANGDMLAYSAGGFIVLVVIAFSLIGYYIGRRYSD